MSKSGSSVFPRQHRKTDVLGARVHLVVTSGGPAITRRDTLRVLQHKLNITDRQARAAVSSYMWEGWPEPYRGLNEPFSLVNSLENRVLVHCDRSYESRVANGRRGGRPPKRPTWDVTPGSGRLANLQPIETRVTGLEETGSAQMWPLSGPYSDD